MTAKRCSPLDGGNLNRAFPGAPNGTPTSRLAHFLEGALFPRHDVVFDIHSGGTSMDHLLCALIECDDDATKQEKALSLMQRLGLPFGFVADNGPAAPTSMGAARRAGAIGVSGEFGGCGTTTPVTMAATAPAIDNLLTALGIVDGPVLSDRTSEGGTMRILSLARQTQAIYATRRGWFEPAVLPGTVVSTGDIAGWLHGLERLDAPEEVLRFAEGGIVLSRRLHTMCEAGDCLVQVAELIA